MMTKRNIAAILLLFVFVLGGCKDVGAAVPSGPPPTPAPAAETDPPSTPEPAPTPDPIGEKIAQMTLGELTGQLLVVGVRGSTPGDDAHQVTEDLHVGGIILFSRNVESANQLADLTNGLKEINREAGSIPLFLCVDEEGGRVSRMPPEIVDVPTAYSYFQNSAIGELEKDIYNRGKVLGMECAAFGLHVDFAPVLDIWSNPDNTVIGDRAFGRDDHTVSVLGALTAQGISEAGVIPVGKHFPGHGDTVTDSHVGLPVVNKTAAELELLELPPFRQAVEEGIPALMVAHILLTQLDPLLPASLSPAVVDGLLRRDLGFSGVVFTDDLTMGAISNTCGVGEAAVKAVEAGCDMLLVCHGLDNAQAAHAALLAAVEDGALTRQRLEESVRRVLELKEAYGVDDSPVEPPDVEALNERIQAVLP